MAPRTDTPVRERTKRRQLPDQVASYVREQIMTGRMRPGDFLRMEPIAEAVGVSITPVREGLLTLRSEGFVTLVPRRGFRVAEFTRQDVRDLFWAQAQLAGELAARTATNATPELLAGLRQINDATERAAEAGDVERLGELGHAFHREINLAANSNRLARLLAGVVNHLPNQFYASLEAHVDATRRQHVELVEALGRRDAQACRTIMEMHLIDSADHIIAMLEQAGLWTAPDA